jgi:hypothetical protein
MGVENPVIQISLLYIAIWIIFAVTATFAYAYAHLWWKQKIPKINNMKMEKIKTLRSFMDRRSGGDRRKVHNIDYLLNGGIERRRGVERRAKVERRTDWVKVSEWQSVDQSLLTKAIDFKKTRKSSNPLVENQVFRTSKSDFPRLTDRER